MQTGIFSLGGIHLDYADWKGGLARIAEFGLKGIKIHPVYQRVDIDDIRYLRILDRTAELGLFVLAHAGNDPGFPGVVNCSPAQILRAVRQIPGITFIAAHMGGWKNWEDTSLLGEERFLQMVELFGAKRVLFGTDSPWSSQKTSLAWIQALPLEQEKKEAILGGNARKLLGI